MNTILKEQIDISRNYNNKSNNNGENFFIFPYDFCAINKDELTPGSKVLLICLLNYLNKTNLKPNISKWSELLNLNKITVYKFYYLLEKKKWIKKEKNCLYNIEPALDKVKLFLNEDFKCKNKCPILENKFGNDFKSRFFMYVPSIYLNFTVSYNSILIMAYLTNKCKSNNDSFIHLDKDEVKKIFSLSNNSLNKILKNLVDKEYITIYNKNIVNIDGIRTKNKQKLYLKLSFKDELNRLELI